MMTARQTVFVLATLLAVAYARPVYAQEAATLRVSPPAFNVKIFVNGKELGTVNEVAKEFQYEPRPGPNVLTVQSERFKTVFATAISSQPGSIHSVRNIRYEPKRTAKPVLAIVSCSEAGRPAAGEAKADRLRYQKTYPRTVTYWKAVVDANAKAQKSLDKMSLFTFDRINKELKITENLGAAFAEIDEGDVDPDLVSAFKQVTKYLRAIVPARRGVENQWNMVGLMSGLKAAAGDLASLNLPNLVGELQSVGDVYILLDMGAGARLKSLHAILDVMEYRYGDNFPKITPAYNSKNALVAFSRKMADALKEE
jgi:hypothetical protein